MDYLVEILNNVRLL